MRTRTLLENSRKELLELLDEVAFRMSQRYKTNEIASMQPRQEITRKGGSVVVLYQ